VTAGPALSGGQRRRLDVGLALIGNPALLFLDEPTTGFEPSARHYAWDVIAGLRELGKTVFLTTHYMDEAEALADRVAVIVHGLIVAEGTPPTSAAANATGSSSRSSCAPGSTFPLCPSRARMSYASSGVGSSCTPSGRPRRSPRSRAGPLSAASSCTRSRCTGRPWRMSTCG
jgi:ABC-2 type transport system ATP-binding protein